MNNDKSKDLQVSKKDDNLPSEKSIRLSQTDVLDLSGLSEEESRQLKKEYVSGIIDVHKKAAVRDIFPWAAFSVLPITTSVLPSELSCV